ncbi:MAG: hypothetical protein IJR45_04685 [Firmicutes bacterium]|nr:hypothetical protein [Bacillota bacterium]
MKKTYKRPEAAFTVFSSKDMTNAVSISSVLDLGKVKKNDGNTVTFGDKS